MLVFLCHRAGLTEVLLIEGSVGLKIIKLHPGFKPGRTHLAKMSQSFGHPVLQEEIVGHAEMVTIIERLPLAKDFEEAEVLIPGHKIQNTVFPTKGVSPVIHQRAVFQVLEATTVDRVY